MSSSVFMRTVSVAFAAIAAISVCYGQPANAQAAAPQRVAGDDLGYRIGQIDAKIDGINSTMKELRDLVLKVQQEQVAQGNRITDLERQAKVGEFVLAALFVAVLGQLITSYFKPKAEISARTLAGEERGIGSIQTLRRPVSGTDEAEANARTIRMVQAIIEEYQHRDVDDPRRARLLEALFQAVRRQPGGETQTAPSKT